MDAKWLRAWRGHELRAQSGDLLARIIRLPLIAPGQQLVSDNTASSRAGVELTGIRSNVKGYAWASHAAHGVATSLNTARSRATSAVRTGLIQPDLFVEPEYRGLPSHVVLLQWARLIVGSDIKDE